LARNIRIEADLVDHLFNSSEKRFGAGAVAAGPIRRSAGPERRIPTISQETLADMINTSLLSVVLHD
jgi:CRP/FNR family transcriptional regulator, cyclic AMP receptor protein